MLDGTPILDVKRYLSSVPDRRCDAAGSRTRSRAHSKPGDPGAGSRRGTLTRRGTVILTIRAAKGYSAVEVDRWPSHDFADDVS
jgi:hypothetical protein